MSIVPGTLLIHDGTKIVPLDPSGEDGMALTFDSNTPSKLKWANTGKSFKVNLPPNNSVKTTYYTSVTEFSLSKMEYTSLASIKIVSYMQKHIDSYDVRIYDMTNNKVLAEQSYKNTDRQINSITKFTNMPDGDAIIEIQCKKNGGRKNSEVTIKDIDIFYV